MKLSVNFQGGTRYEITSGNHRVITDQPAADSGQDTGMSPVELFVGSVASCVGTSWDDFVPGTTSRSRA